MKIVRLALALLASVGLSISLLPATAAEAAPSGVPLTCGMVIDHDATVYLKRSLHCPSFAVRVVGIMGQNAYPHVVIDLRGHTLSGPGTERGITAIGAPITWPSVEVRNGRMTGWDEAVVADADGAVHNVILAHNRIGFWCGGHCTVTGSRFTANTERGFLGAAESYATISRSFFHRNPVGASVWGIPFSLEVSRSTFLANGVGVAGYQGATLTVTGSRFIGNRTGVSYEQVQGDGCVTLDRDRFHHNVVDLDGPSC